MGGTATDRAMAALTRIGPSVFHALFSTLLAVLVIGFSKSFVFQVFFKVLFLVTTIAGAHGILLLPVLLSLVGGDSSAEDDAASQPAEKTEALRGISGITLLARRKHARHIEPAAAVWCGW